MKVWIIITLSQGTDLFTYSFRFPTPQLLFSCYFARCQCAATNLDFLVELGLLNPGIVEVCWSLLKFVEVCWSLLKFVEVCWSLLKFVEVCWSLLKFVEVCWNSVSWPLSFSCSSPPCDVMTIYTPPPPPPPPTGSKIFMLSFLYEYWTKNFQIFLYQVMHQGQRNKTIKKLYLFQFSYPLVCIY